VIEKAEHRQQVNGRRLRKLAITDQIRATCQRLLWLRDVHGWSQQKTADNIGITQGALAHYEIGRRVLDPYRAIEIAALFKTTLRFLYQGDFHQPGAAMVQGGWHPPNGAVSSAVSASPKTRNSEPERQSPGIKGNVLHTGLNQGNVLLLETC
jgi:transcriptional regulator with XRE-family HTH domain